MIVWISNSRDGFCFITWTLGLTLYWVDNQELSLLWSNTAIEDPKIWTYWSCLFLLDKQMTTLLQRPSIILLRQLSAEFWVHSSSHWRCGDSMSSNRSLIQLIARRMRQYHRSVVHISVANSQSHELTRIVILDALSKATLASMMYETFPWYPRLYKRIEGWLFHLQSPTLASDE